VAVVKGGGSPIQSQLTAGDPASREIYRRHQERCIRRESSTLGGEQSWPAELGEPDRVIGVSMDSPLRGWRMWRVDGDRLVAPFITALYGAGHTTPGMAWAKGVNENSTYGCQVAGSHPGPRCWCGIRAVQSLTVLAAYARDQYWRIGPPVAAAEVEVWGRVASFKPDDDWRHTLRAQYAQIIGPIHLGAEVEAHRADIERRYDIEPGGGCTRCLFGWAWHSCS
jgi:hypothetical protein